MEPDLVLVGFVVGLDYKNPYLNPYKTFQQWKHHKGELVSCTRLRTTIYTQTRSLAVRHAVTVQYDCCCPICTKLHSFASFPRRLETPRRRRAHFVRRTLSERGRLPLHPAPQLPRGAVDRMRRRVPECYEDQGLAHRHEVWHGEWTGGRQGDGTRRVCQQLCIRRAGCSMHGTSRPTIPTTLAQRWPRRQFSTNSRVVRPCTCVLVGLTIGIMCYAGDVVCDVELSLFCSSNEPCVMLLHATCLPAAATTTCGWTKAMILPCHPPLPQVRR